MVVRRIKQTQTSTMRPNPEPPPTLSTRTTAHIAETLIYAPTSALAITGKTFNDADLSSADMTPAYTMHVELPAEAPNIHPGVELQHELPQTMSPKHHIAAIRLMQHATNTPIPMHHQLRLHIDGGANRSVTNNPLILLNYKNTKPYYMSSAGGENDITYTGIGYLPWRSPDGDTVLIKCYHSDQAPETIISPSDIAMNHLSTYHSWTQYANLKTNKGYIKFINQTNGDTINYPLINQNNLWYYINDDMNDYSPVGAISTPTIRRLTNNTMYQLMHARLGHPGERVMQDVHKHAEGIPRLKKPPLFKCPSCTLVNATKRAVTQQEVYTALEQVALPLQTGPPDPPPSITKQEELEPGQVFQMDMGFVRSTKYKHQEDGHLVTSMDGYNGYLVVVDRATRYTWLFLSRTKLPPLDLIKAFLHTHGSKTTSLKRIRTDQGGELWGSHDFQRMVQSTGFLLEPTAADASFQNGVAERPNCSLADIMRALLHTADMGPEYWSWAILHALYLKNRLPHRAMGMSPYQAYTGKKPNLKHVRLFGCPVTVRNPGRRPAKLDIHATTGIFLGFTATNKNIYYIDNTTKKV